MNRFGRFPASPAITRLRPALGIGARDRRPARGSGDWRPHQVNSIGIILKSVDRLAPSLSIVLTLALLQLDGHAAALVQRTQIPEDPVLAAIAVAAEMPPLASVSVPSGYREIRVRSEQVLANLESAPMIRLVEGPSDVRGEVWLFRTLVLRAGNPGPRDDERCAPMRDQHICVRVGQLRSGDWTLVAARLEQLGAWTLSDPCNPPRMVTTPDGSRSMARGIPGDAGLLSVHRRVGSTVSSFDCSGPGNQREDDGRRANEIYSYLMELTGFSRP